RRDDVVTINGVNVAINAVEEALNNCAGVQGCAVVAAPDAGDELQLFAAVTVLEPVDDPVEFRHALRSEVIAALGLAAAPRYLAFLDSLPMLPNNKIDRRALVDLTADGVLWQR
ncbi:MAG: hypothetical protein WC005_11045, partial [Candidatus Nanopelagicales bacterium]